MSSPTFSDALSYVVDAQAEILSAVADCKSYADAAAEGIFPTYEDQGRVLGSVNKRLEEMRKEDAERMTLALTSRGCRPDRVVRGRGRRCSPGCR
jgi:hypothetical protein